MKIIIGVLGLVAAAASIGLGQSPTSKASSAANANEAQVRQFIDNFADSFTRNDAGSLEKVTSAEYSFIAPNGEIQDKETRYAPIKSGDLKYTSVKYTDVAVRLYGDTAVVTATVDVNSRLKGNDISGKFRSTLTLIKVKGRWMLVASQANKI